MSRLISRILAIKRYMDIVIGVTQWPESLLKMCEYISRMYNHVEMRRRRSYPPVTQAGWRGSSPQGGSISSANTSPYNMK